MNRALWSAILLATAAGPAGCIEAASDDPADLSVACGPGTRIQGDRCLVDDTGDREGAAGSPGQSGPEANGGEGGAFTIQYCTSRTCTLVASCPDGTTLVDGVCVANRAPTCTVADNDDGSATISCPDGSQVTVSTEAASVSIAEEPPGENCALGGKRIDAGDTTEYFCTQPPIDAALAELCPGTSTATPGLYAHMVANGNEVGWLETPGENEGLGMELAAVCYGVSSAYDHNNAFLGRVVTRPLYLVMRAIGSAPVQPRLLRAWNNNQNIELTIETFDESSSPPTLLSRTSTTPGNARIISVEYLSRADPTAPGGFDDFVRVALLPETLTVEDEATGVIATATVANATLAETAPLLAELAAPENCVGAYGTDTEHYASSFEADGYDILATSEVRGRELAAFCYAAPADRPGDQQVEWIALVRRSDERSPFLLQAYELNQEVTVEVDSWTTGDSPVQYYTVTVEGRIRDIQFFEQDGEPFERITLFPDNVMWTENSGGMEWKWDSHLS